MRLAGNHKVLAGMSGPALLAAIRSESNPMPPTLLTFALEFAGATVPRGEAVPLLLAHLGHTDAMVREGAVYGLAHHEGGEIDLALAWLAEADPSPGVRAAAGGQL